MKNRSRQPVKKSRALKVLPKQGQAMQHAADVARGVVDLGRPLIQYWAVREAMAERRAAVAADAAMRHAELRSHVELESQRIQSVGGERRAMIEAYGRLLRDPRADIALKSEALRAMAAMASGDAYGPFEPLPRGGLSALSQRAEAAPIDVEFRDLSEVQPAK